MTALQIILYASIGAIFQEVLHWYALRKKLDQKAYRKTLTSITYWIVTLVMIVCSGLGTYALLEDAQNLKLFHYVIVGAAFPALFTKIVGSFVTDKVSLGNSISFFGVLKNYFR